MTLNRGSVFSDFTAAAAWAGITAFVWYAFGGVPLHIAVSGQLGITTAQTSSWIFILWSSGAVATIWLSLQFRQPLPITWTIPGLVYLGTLAERFTFAEIVGANLVAGVVLIVLGLAGIGRAIMRWLPLPIVMGMFGGSILVYVLRMVSATVEDVAVAGTAVACFLAGRAIANPRVPPVALAVVGGGIAVTLTGTVGSSAVEWAIPALVVPDMSFSLPALIGVSLPMVVLAMGLGNVQGIGFLLAQGYRVPVNTVSTAVGVASVANAFLGGHAATVARNGVAILASTEAGPPAGRYWGAVISSALTLILALAATPVASLLNVLPKTYIFAVAGLAILSAFQDTVEKSFGGKLRFGALAGFIVAATPFAILGITSAFWAIIAGVAASALVERQQLLDYWKDRGEERS
jgi:benzoate membrane transport protein